MRLRTTRIAEISSREEFSAELRRELIRDSRWRRRRDMIKVLAPRLGVLVLGVGTLLGAPHAVSLLAGVL